MIKKSRIPTVSERLRRANRALEIAADMFSCAGYVTDTGNDEPEAIKKWLELREEAAE